MQYNDGFRSNLIGTPQQIAERILSLKDAGADLILLGFLHFQEEVEYFGRHVIPLVREFEARRAKPAQRRNNGGSHRQGRHHDLARMRPFPFAGTAGGATLLADWCCHLEARRRRRDVGSPCPATA